MFTSVLDDMVLERWVMGDGWAIKNKDDVTSDEQTSNRNSLGQKYLSEATH